MPQIQFNKDRTFDDAEIYFWHIAESCNELSELIADNGALLAEAQKRFKSVTRQCEWLAVRALLLQTPYKEKEILYHSNGQPYLDGKFISISHTNEHAAIAISDNPIGIDIEAVGRDAQSVIKAILHPTDSAPSTPDEALHMWVAKEAAFKLAPEKATVLKEISITKNNYSYTVAYPDGTTAECTIHILGNIILAYCTI